MTKKDLKFSEIFAEHLTDFVKNEIKAFQEENKILAPIEISLGFLTRSIAFTKKYYSGDLGWDNWFTMNVYILLKEFQNWCPVCERMEDFCICKKETKKEEKK